MLVKRRYAIKKSSRRRSGHRDWIYMGARKMKNYCDNWSTCLLKINNVSIRSIQNVLLIKTLITSEWLLVICITSARQANCLQYPQWRPAEGWQSPIFSIHLKSLVSHILKGFNEYFMEEPIQPRNEAIVWSNFIPSRNWFLS